MLCGVTNLTIWLLVYLKIVDTSEKKLAWPLLDGLEDKTFQTTTKPQFLYTASNSFHPICPFRSIFGHTDPNLTFLHLYFGVPTWLNCMFATDTTRATLSSFGELRREIREKFGTLYAYQPIVNSVSLKYVAKRSCNDEIDPC